MTAILPPRPARAVLSPYAKRALTSAYPAVDGRFYLQYLDTADDLIDELQGHKLVEPAGTESNHIRSVKWVVTAAGELMTAHLRYQTRLRWLANRVREESITGEDLVDIAADVDNGAESYIGCSAVFYHAFAELAAQSRQSGEDLRGELESFLDWS